MLTRLTTWLVGAIVLFIFAMGAAQAQVTPSQVPLYWDAPTIGPNQRAPDYFDIERSVSACAAASTWTQIDQVGAQVFNIVDINVQQGTTYCYRAFSSDIAGNRSVASNLLEVAVPLGELGVVQNLRTTP